MRGRSWLDVVPKLPTWVVGVTSFVTALVGLVERWRGGPTVVTAVLVATGVAGCLLGCVYVAFKRSPPLVGARGPWQYPRARPWALAGLAVLAAIALGASGSYVVDRYLSPQKVIILVADFDGERPRDYSVTHQILDKLRAAMEPYRDEVKILALDDVITTQGGPDLARAKGSEKGASVVLWGRYAVTRTTVRITVHFELLRPTPAFSPNQPTQVVTATPDALDGFTLQTDLSGQMSYLTLLSLGAARLDARRYDKAIDAFTDALTQGRAPEDIVDPGEIYVLRGTAYLAQGDFDRALADMDRAVQHGSDRTASHVARGFLHLSRLDHDAGFEDLSTAIESAPPRDTTGDVKTRSKLAAAHWGRGMAYRMKGDEPGGRADFRQVIDLLKPDRPEQFVVRGQAHQYTGDLDKAIADFSRSLELDPHDACGCAYLARAEAYLAKKDARRGLADLDRASRNAPRSPMPHLTRGIFLSDQGDHAAAIAALSEAIARNENLGIAYTVRGHAYKATGEDEKALADFTRAIALMPNVAQGHMARGQFHRERKDYARAIGDFSRAVALDPRQHLGWVERAHAYLETGRYDLAIADADRAIELGPGTFLVAGHLMRGRAHLAKGAVDAAIADFTRAIEVQPSPSTYAYRATTYRQKGDKARALSDLNEARRHAPEGSPRRRWIEDEVEKVQAMPDR